MLVVIPWANSRETVRTTSTLNNKHSVRPLMSTFSQASKPQPAVSSVCLKLSFCFPYSFLCCALTLYKRTGIKLHIWVQSSREGAKHWENIGGKYWFCFLRFKRPIHVQWFCIYFGCPFIVQTSPSRENNEVRGRWFCDIEIEKCTANSDSNVLNGNSKMYLLCRRQKYVFFMVFQHFWHSTLGFISYKLNVKV